jgi:pyruvate formate lyase activating enzyme
MRDFLDCITVDFKGSGETGFARKYITIANADPIFQTLLELRDKTKVHIEITDLIVPEVGDDLGAAKKLSSWIYDNLGPDTPIHFLRFHPDYKMMNLPPTPIETLEKHHKIAKEAGLNYAYIGNVPGHPLEHTYCPECRKVVVERLGFDITGWNLDERNSCKYCGNEIAIVGRLSESINEERFVPIIM